MLADRTQMLALAASVGCVAALAELMDARGCAAGPADPYARACRAASAHGQLEALVWLRGRGCPWSTASALLVEAISRCCGTCTSMAAPMGEDTCMRAAEGGHLEVLRYARDEHGCP
jgi:hypothetical protein